MHLHQFMFEAMWWKGPTLHAVYVSLEELKMPLCTPFAWYYLPRKIYACPDTCVYRNTVFLFMLDCSSPATLQIIQWKLLPLHVKLCGPGQRELFQICQVKFPIQRRSKEARGEEEGRGDGGEESVTCTFRVWDISGRIEAFHSSIRDNLIVAHSSPAGLRELCKA